MVEAVSRVNRITLEATASDGTDVFISDTYDKLPEELSKEVALKTAETAPQFKTTADILFILESSGSIRPADYQKQLQFVAYVISNFNIGPSEVLFSVMLFSSEPQMLFDFTLTSHDDVIRAIQTAPHISHEKNTAAALDLARTVAFTSVCGSRNGKKIAIIITDGCSNDMYETYRAAKQLKECGVLTLAIGVGDFNQAELKRIATLPENVYTVDNYNVLRAIRDAVSEKTCKLNKQTIMSGEPDEVRHIRPDNQTIINQHVDAERDTIPEERTAISQDADKERYVTKEHYTTMSEDADEGKNTVIPQIVEKDRYINADNHTYITKDADEKRCNETEEQISEDINMTNYNKPEERSILPQSGDEIQYIAPEKNTAMSQDADENQFIKPDKHITIIQDAFEERYIGVEDHATISSNDDKERYIKPKEQATINQDADTELPIKPDKNTTIPQDADGNRYFQPEEQISTSEDTDVRIDTKPQEQITTSEDSDVRIDTKATEEITTSEDSDVRIDTKPQQQKITSEDTDVRIDTKPKEQITTSEDSDVRIDTKQQEQISTSKDTDVRIDTKPEDQIITSEDTDVTIDTKSEDQIITSEATDVAIDTKPQNKITTSEDTHVRIDSKPEDLIITFENTDVTIDNKREDPIITPEDTDVSNYNKSEEQITKSRDTDVTINTKPEGQITISENSDVRFDTKPTEEITTFEDTDVKIDTKPEETISQKADPWLNDFKKLSLNMPASSMHRNQINILLCGPHRHGKSSTGNSILGSQEFSVFSEVKTETATFELKSAMYGNYKLKIVDCPPTPREKPSNAKMVLQSFRSMAKLLLQLCPKGIHAVVIVLEYRGVFSEDLEYLMFMLKELYGNKFIQNHCICVVSHGDVFKKRMERSRAPGAVLDFDSWCKKQGPDSDLGKIFTLCQYRCVLFDNVTTDMDIKRTQVQQLMSMIADTWYDPSLVPLVSVNPNIRVKADIHLLIETAPTYDEYQSQLLFAANYASNYKISPDTARACVMIFGQDDHLRMGFSALNTHEELKQALFRAPFLNQSSGTERALMLARQESFGPSGGTRQGVQQMVVMVTEGRTADESKTVEEADLLKSLGAEILVVGVSRVNRITLAAIASDPADVFISDTYDELHELPKEVALKTAEKAPQFKLTADILFILDSSGSISPEDYQKELQFVEYVTSNFNIGPTEVLFSIMLFSHVAAILFDFSLTSHDILKQALRAAPHIKHGTDTAAALQLARTEAFTLRCCCRRGKKIAIIITDGCSNDIYETANQAELLRESGVLTLAVGVGNIYKTELEHISTLPEDVFTVDNYSVLQTIQDELSDKTCKLETAMKNEVARPPLVPFADFAS